MKIVKTFSERLKAFRIVAGLSQTELAARSGVPASVIRNYEQQRNAPLLENAIKLARALGQPLEAFLPSEGTDTSEGKASGPKRKKK